MRVLVVGGGGREHAISKAISISPLLKKLIVAPGNPGIEKFAECRSIDVDNIQGLCNLAKEMKADIVVIGPELPLVLGLKDRLSIIGIPSFGPSKNASKLEGSKIFSRNFCERHQIPQPQFTHCKDMLTARKIIEAHDGKCVVKADGLAAGKGVTVCNNTSEAMLTASNMLEKKIFGESGNSILIEEKIEGVEASVFALSDGDDFVIIGTAQDYKRAYDNNIGPNTGGMGAISPAPAINDEILEIIKKKIINPTIKGMKKEKTKYKGILYAGIMITNDGPKVIEFNCRFGDPEAQVIIPRFKFDMLDMIVKACHNNLSGIKILLSNQVALTVVIATKGYPNKFKKNQLLPPLNNLENLKDIFIYHSGTKFDENKNLVNSGGRVLSITGIDKNLINAKRKIYDIVKKINWKYGFCRQDIGKL